MSETMKERIARALCIADGKDPDADWRVEPSNGLTLDVIDDTPQNWRLYVEKASIVIEALREPTEKMKNCKHTHWDYGCYVCGGLKEGWYAMIDEALNE